MSQIGWMAGLLYKSTLLSNSVSNQYNLHAVLAAGPIAAQNLAVFSQAVT